jgi:gamma-glutamylcyclotransferase (GGCT)/AIG2-like uncharacterized protein YtfP
MNTPIDAVLLFSYGTLQNKDVQIANFGRELAGRPDGLSGYTRGVVHAVTGESHYANLEARSNLLDSVSGIVFEITSQELAAADRYEAGADYRRIAVTLQSGCRAWVYLHSPSTL